MNTEQVINETFEKYEQYLNPALARLFRFMGLAAVEWEASGDIIKDSNGKIYIDCLGGYGVFSLGHRHPAVVNAVKRQLDLMPLSSKILLNKPMADLGALLAEITPGDLQYSFFCNSGTEAVEGALKLARIYTGRPNFISTANSFHGKTLGALSATGRELFKAPFEPLLPGFRHVPFNDVEALQHALNDSVAAVIVEPIQGEGGIILPSEDYLPKVRAMCTQAGALLICDEVQTGLGRTGTMFAIEHTGVVPDILCTAKALGGGVMPIGAFTANARVWEPYVTSPFLHTSTFGGNPLACVAAIETIGIIRDEQLPAQAARSGEYLQKGLQDLASIYPDVIAKVRGRGLMLGIELTKEGVGGFLISELIADGILVAYTLNNPKVIRLEPPLSISKASLERVLQSFQSAIAKAALIIEDL